MVYHEIRKVNGKKLNYLVHNKRENGKFKKKSKFVGEGNFSKEKIHLLKEEFEKELKKENLAFLSKEEVEEIENLNEIYSKKLERFSKEEFEKFEKAFFTELTYNSNAIEGNSLSLQETSLVINENLVPEGKTVREIYEARNHLEAIKMIKSWEKDLTEEFILKIHAIILRDISGRFAGRYRENPVKVLGSDAKFPDSEKVPQLVKNLVYWYSLNKKKIHPFELAVVFSMKLVSIHPFVDGNGRISRLLMNFILLKNKYPWINVYMKQRVNYLKAVRLANDEKYSYVLEFMINSLRENLRDFGFL